MGIQKNIKNTIINNDADAVKMALRELQTALKKEYGSNSPKILVYGSQARREANATSDIDVLLIYPHAIQPGQEIRRVSSILADLNLQYQVLISVLPTTRIQYDQATDPFWDNVKKEGITIDGI